MADTSIGSDSRQRLLQLIDDLLSPARSAMCETESLGSLVAEILFLDPGEARSAATYLDKLGYFGDALRLEEDVGHLRKNACDVFRGPFVTEPTSNDQQQARRDLEALHHEVCRLVDFLGELESLVGHASSVGEKVSDQVNEKSPAAKPGNETKTTADGTLWKHSPTDCKPDKFREGPLYGSNKKLCQAMGEKAKRNYRWLSQKAKIGRVWVIAPTPTARRLEIWFDNLLELRRVAEALKKVTNKQPVENSHGSQ